MRGLIVDDDLTSRLLMLGMLEALGLAADAVSNGNDALGALQDSWYDVVLMDLHMPVMGGEETTRRIRDPNTATKNHETVVIAITAGGTGTHPERCLELGMNDYLLKPVFMEHLDEKLNKWLPEEP